MVRCRVLEHLYWVTMLLPRLRRSSISASATAPCTRKPRPSAEGWGDSTSHTLRRTPR